MRTGYQRAFLIAAVVALSAAAMMGIFAVFAELGDTGGKILATTLMVAAAAVIALASATAKSHERGCTAHGHVGMWAAGLGLAAALTLLWGDPVIEEWEWLARTAACLGVVALAAPHGGLLAVARLRPRMEWMRLTTRIAAAVLTGTILLVILADFNVGDALVKTITVAAIVTTFGTIAVPILHKVSGLGGELGRSTVTNETISLTCPRCGAAHELPFGSSECPSCELEFTIEVNEKRCPCGYPLYGLTVQTGCLLEPRYVVCPECGTRHPTKSAAQ